MTDLDTVPIEDLETALEDVETKQATERLMLAILDKQARWAPAIAEWYGVPEGTIYNWFDRLEERQFATHLPTILVRIGRRNLEKRRSWRSDRQ